MRNAATLRSYLATHSPNCETFSSLDQSANHTQHRIYIHITPKAMRRDIWSFLYCLRNFKVFVVFNKTTDVIHRLNITTTVIKICNIRIQRISCEEKTYTKVIYYILRHSLYLICVYFTPTENNELSSNRKKGICLMDSTACRKHKQAELTFCVCLCSCVSDDQPKPFFPYSFASFPPGYGSEITVWPRKWSNYFNCTEQPPFARVYCVSVGILLAINTNLLSTDLVICVVKTTVYKCNMLAEWIHLIWYLYS